MIEIENYIFEMPNSRPRSRIKLPNWIRSNLTISAPDLENRSDKKKPILAIEKLILNIDSGGLIWLLGPNGAGKTTLLKALAGLPEPSNCIKLMGKPLDTYHNQERSQLLTYIPEKQSLPFSLTVESFLRYSLYPWNQGRVCQSDHHLIETALADLGMISYKNRNMQTLSSGETKKIHIARALISKGPLVLMDEPFANLDLANSESFSSLLLTLAVTFKKALIISVHDLSIISKLKGTVIGLKSGKIHGVWLAESLNSSIISGLFDLLT